MGPGVCSHENHRVLAVVASTTAVLKCRVWANTGRPVGRSGSIKCRAGRPAPPARCSTAPREGDSCGRRGISTSAQGRQTFGEGRGRRLRGQWSRGEKRAGGERIREAKEALRWAAPAGPELFVRLHLRALGRRRVDSNEPAGAGRAGRARRPLGRRPDRRVGAEGMREVSSRCWGSGECRGGGKREERRENGVKKT